MSSLGDKYTANLLHYLFHKNAIISTMIFLRLNTCIVHINYHNIITTIINQL